MKIPINLELELNGHRAPDGEGGYYNTTVEDSVLYQAGRIIAEKLESAVSEQIKKQVASTATDVIESMLAKHVDAILASGYEYFDRFGGKKTSKPVAQMIEEALSKSNGRDGTILENIVKDKVTDYLKFRADKELAESIAKIKQAVDDGLVDKFKEAMRSALGLRL